MYNFLLEILIRSFEDGLENLQRRGGKGRGEESSDMNDRNYSLNCNGSGAPSAVDRRDCS